MAAGGNRPLIIRLVGGIVAKLLAMCGNSLGLEKIGFVTGGLTGAPGKPCELLAEERFEVLEESEPGGLLSPQHFSAML